MAEPTRAPAPNGRQRYSRAELEAARTLEVPDLLAANLDVLFCGINPGLYSAASGLHFAGPGNRFWRALAGAGLTPRILTPQEKDDLLRAGCGITNVVPRTTAAASELSRAELRAGARALEAKVLRLRPRILAVLGIGAYRTGFGRPQAVLGLQPERIGTTLLWVLPNPSGLNAHYRVEDLIRLFRELRDPRLRD